MSRMPVSTPASLMLAGGDERDAGCSLRGRNDDPTLAVADGDIAPSREAECVDVEADRPVLVGDRDSDRADLFDLDGGVW